MRTALARLAASLALAVLLAPGLRSQAAEPDEDLTEIAVWGAVSSIIETDDEGDGRIAGFSLNTDEGESYEIVQDELGLKLAAEASDRTDVVVEVEGTLSIDQTMVTVHHFRLLFVDENADHDGEAVTGGDPDAGDDAGEPPESDAGDEDESGEG